MAIVETNNTCSNLNMSVIPLTYNNVSAKGWSKTKESLPYKIKK